MYLYFFLLSALLYAVCAFLPAKYRTAIAAGTAIGWLLHGVALWADVIAPGSLRQKFAIMLSAALWISVGAYWLENRNFSLDGLRVLKKPKTTKTKNQPAIF